MTTAAVQWIEAIVLTACAVVMLLNLRRARRTLRRIEDNTKELERLFGKK